MNKKTTVPFRGTDEQKRKLLAVISELKDEKGALMPIMQHAQEIYGYLPIEVQKIIAEQTGIPMSKIYGVATFYSQFNLNPKGKYQISVCLGDRMLCQGCGEYYRTGYSSIWGLRMADVRRTANFPWIPAAVSVPAAWHLS